ncbi:hypothetical protein HYS54_02740 [Candidatus Micrarchaeota archaeon]|nr:hypothetical protein [Candidatus Micrarchaeota archaeon]
MKETHKHHKVSFELDKICLQEFGYAPSELNDLYDIMEDCAGLIHYYTETAGSLSEESRNRLFDLATEKDLIILGLDELYLKSARFTALAKKKHYLSHAPQADQLELKEFRKHVDEMYGRVGRLLKGIRSYVEFIKNHKASVYA